MDRLPICAGIFAFVATASAMPTSAQEKPLGYLPRSAYPTEAIRARQDGGVMTHLVIATDGSVKTCVVTASSGSPALDAGACDIARKNVHYTPARDTAGHPVESSVDLPIRFKLPDTPPPPGWPDGRVSATPAPAP